MIAWVCMGSRWTWLLLHRRAWCLNFFPAPALSNHRSPLPAAAPPADPHYSSTTHLSSSTAPTITSPPFGTVQLILWLPSLVLLAPFQPSLSSQSWLPCQPQRKHSISREGIRDTRTTIMSQPKTSSKSKSSKSDSSKVHKLALKGSSKVVNEFVSR